MHSTALLAVRSSTVDIGFLGGVNVSLFFFDVTCLLVILCNVTEADRKLSFWHYFSCTMLGAEFWFLMGKLTGVSSAFA